MPLSTVIGLGCGIVVGVEMKFHCVAEPVRDSGTFGMLMLNPFTLVLLLSDEAAPALATPAVASSLRQGPGRSGRRDSPGSVAVWA